MSVLVIENRNGGFFSDFNLILGSLEYLKLMNIDDFYIMWNNKRYQDNTDNLFDEYFFKQDKNFNNKKFNQTFSTEQIGISLQKSPIINIETCKALNKTLHDICHSDKKKIIYDVLLDVISLSKCKELILTSSNVAATALYINPNIKFKQIDTHIYQ